MTSKKVRQVAKQWSESLCGSFRAQAFLFRREMFVWVDETGTDRRDNIHKFGYSLRGTSPECRRILFRGERLNAIAVLSSAGIVAVEFTKQTVTGEAFFDFLRGILIPCMRPFNGINPHSVLVLDNCTVQGFIWGACPPSWKSQVAIFFQRVIGRNGYRTEAQHK